MKYDMEIIVPMCLKSVERIEDFKRYGIFNTSGKKILVTAILSNDEEIENIEEGWPEGVDFRKKKNKNPDHVSNLYKFYAELTPETLESRWIMRIDDDSCNDVGQLIDNLDTFYDWEDKFYLGDLNDFLHAMRGNEGNVYPEYKHLLGDLENLVSIFKNETECGIISRGGILNMLSNSKCMHLIKSRSELKGGYGDCVVALAATLCKLYPLQCPFLSYKPNIINFSLFGGHINHIHMVSRKHEGENFDNWERCGDVQYSAIMKAIDKDMSENEKKICGKKMMMETENELRLYEFKENRTLTIKFDERKYVWVEHEDSIKIFHEPREIEASFKVKENSLIGKDRGERKIELKIINY